MGSIRDEELFVHTQPQEDEGEVSDNIYLELAKAITERKCRIVQKKVKIKLIIDEVTKLNEKLKIIATEEKSLKKDIEEINCQKTLRVQNIQNDQNACSTLQTNLCEVIHSVSTEKAETKRKKDEYDAAIKDARDTWVSYKEIYDNFPLSKKFQGVVNEIKNLENALKQADIDIADFKMKKKLKRDEAENGFHKDVVQLAEKYKLYQVKIKQLKEQQEKIMKMKNLIADLKAGKATENQLESTQGSAMTASSKEQDVVHSQQEIFKFTVPGIQVTSPMPSTNENESSREEKLFDWDNLLGCTGLLGPSKTSVEKSAKLTQNTSVSKVAPTSFVPSSRIDSQREKSPYVKKVESSLKLTNLLRNQRVLPRKPEMNIGNKRGNENETVGEGNKQERNPYKKILLTPQTATSSDANEPKSNNKEANENPDQTVIRYSMVKDSSFEKGKKDNANPRTSNSSLNLKPYMSSLDGNTGHRSKVAPTSKGVNQNLMNILSLQYTGKEKKESQRIKHIAKQPETMKNAPANSQNISQNGQQRNFNEGEFSQNANADCQNQQFENIPIMLEPGSPAPDLIPVETTTKPSSQGNILQTCSPIDFNLSGGSDFISPDVDEATKMVYQRMASQGPYPAQEYSKEHLMKTQKPTSEEGVVRSQYFTDAHCLNTPPDGPGDYQSPLEQPYSPPVMGGEFNNSNQFMNSVPSPPPGNTGTFGGSGSAFDKSGFSFMLGSSTNTTNKSIFDLF